MVTVFARLPCDPGQGTQPSTYRLSTYHHNQIRPLQPINSARNTQLVQCKSDKRDSRIFNGN